MNPLFIYLIKASATVFTLWAFYALVLRRMTFHNLNRYFFLAGILISLVWPALPLTEWFSQAPTVNQVVVYIPITAFMMQFKPAPPSFGIEMALKIAFFAGVLFMLVRLTIQIFSLRAIFKKSEVRIINGVKVRVVTEKINPFSFFGYIFLNPENHTPTELAAIILHEKIHETRTHSIDILLSELFKIMLWFNPFSWLFCRAVKENIEFEVDRVLLHQGIDCKEYQYSLLKLSSVKNQIVITNHFNLSNLKIRIIMMNKNQSSRYGLAAYSLVIPLIFLCMVFSYAFAQNKPIADTIKVMTNFQVKPDKPLDKSMEKALFIIDGKVGKMDDVKPENIYSMNVLKGKDATDIYGRKGKDGVVLITTKKEGSEKKTFITYRIKDSIGSKNSKPIFIINGKEISEVEMKELSPDQIESISVLKNEMATSEYGDKGKNGVVKIIMKKGVPLGSAAGSGTSFSTSSSSTGDGKGEGKTMSTVVVTGYGDQKRVTTKNSGDGKTMSTVVVTGYGDQKGVTTKNSSYTYTLKDDKDASGKTIVMTDGGTNEEKNIRIRINPDGKTTTESSSSTNTFKFPEGVLIVLDGVPVDQEAFAKINAKDIETVSVMKGEAAKALWGEKANNGVMVITTKTGAKATKK
jgi:bla regulator protein BlaR1